MENIEAFDKLIEEGHLVEMKRIYRCPNCDAMVLEKVYFNTMHMCSCGAYTHVKNLKLEFARKW